MRFSMMSKIDSILQQIVIKIGEKNIYKFQFLDLMKRKTGNFEMRHIRDVVFYHGAKEWK
jgi:hypothetical protein